LAVWRTSREDCNCSLGASCRLDGNLAFGSISCIVLVDSGWRDSWTYGELENRIKGDVSLNACAEASRHAAEAARERRIVIAGLLLSGPMLTLERSDDEALSSSLPCHASPGKSRRNSSPPKNIKISKPQPPHSLSIVQLYE
jgi:hypothetical protein